MASGACLADRLFSGYSLWTQGRSTGADLLWRVGKTFLLPADKKLPDGSFLSYLYPSVQDRQRQRNGVIVRVIEYRLEGIAGAEPGYRLISTILDHETAPAEELAACRTRSFASAPQQHPRRKAENERILANALSDAAGVRQARNYNP